MSSTTTWDGPASWSTLMRQTMVPVAFGARDLRPERFHFRRTRIGAVEVAEKESSRHSVHCRPRAGVAEPAPEHYQFHLQLAGRARIQQGDNRAELQPGDLALFDLSRPFSLEFDSDSTEALVIFPHDRVPLPPSVVGALTGARLAGDAGLCRIVGQVLRQVIREMDELDSDAGRLVLAHAVGMVAALIWEQVQGVAAEAVDPRRVQLRAVCDHIERHLADPALNPEAIARAHFVSVRRLHSLFSDEGSTVSSWIRGRRLERCRRDLADPALRGETVASIAARNGFVDAAYFSRIFRARYGVTASSTRDAGQAVHAGQAGQAGAVASLPAG